LITEFVKYLFLGFTHVIPLGYDHILFIISLYLLDSKIKSTITQCSIFTLAHSISLGLTTYGLIVPKSNLVESIIALSIVYTAIENIVKTKLSKWRLIIIFFFGLIHGMGFASALKDAGITQNYFIQSLLGFNLGVEMGQILVILITYLVLVRSFAYKASYQEKIVYPISSIIACFGLFWAIIRFMA